MCCTCLSHTQSHRSNYRTSYVVVGTHTIPSTKYIRDRPLLNAHRRVLCSLCWGRPNQHFIQQQQASEYFCPKDRWTSLLAHGKNMVYLKMHAILLCHPYLLLYFVYVLILLLMAHKQEFTQYLVMRMTSKLSFCLVRNQN